MTSLVSLKALAIPTPTLTIHALFLPIGTQIQVFATRRPSGTYLTNVSFSIDGGPPTLWTTSDFVPAITYKNLVYTSPSLRPSQHHITITNLGAIFWLDYVEFTTADSVTSSGGGGGAPPSSTTTSTSSTTSHQIPSSTPPTPTTSISYPSPPQSQSSADTPTTSIAGSSTMTPLTTQTSSSGTTSMSDFESLSTNSMPTISTRSSTGDSDGTALAVPVDSSSGSSSRTPIIIGVVVGVAGLIALLLAALWWLRMRSKRRGQPLPEMTFATAPGKQSSDRPTSSR